MTFLSIERERGVFAQVVTSSKNMKTLGVLKTFSSAVTFFFFLRKCSLGKEKEFQSQIDGQMLEPMLTGPVL
jgi:hypothetical protein